MSSNIRYSDEDFLRELVNVREILKIGQTAQPTPMPEERGSVGQNAAQNAATTAAVAKKLVGRLSQNLGITKEQTSTGDTSEVYVKDLQDLPSLLAFLRANYIQQNGKNIVSDAANAKADPNNPTAPTTVNPDPKIYAEYNLQNDLMQMGGSMGRKVYIYKDGLVSYLKTLQRQAVQEPNELLAAMVGRLIDNVQKELNLKVVPDAEEKPKSGLDDSTELDKLGEILLFETPLVPQREQGTVSLFARDLKSPSAFDAFMHKSKIKKKDKVTTYEEFQDSSYCDVIYILWSRANSYYFRTKAPRDKQYLDLVTSLANEYNCNLQTSNKEKTDGEGNDKNMKNVSWKPGSGQPLTPQMKQQLAAIGVRYPLLRDRVDLRWIVEWVTSYQRIMQAIGAPTETDAVQNVIDISNGLMQQYGVTSQSLQSTAIVIYRNIRDVAIHKMHKQPNEAIHMPMAYVQEMGQVLSNLVRVLQSYKRDFYDSMPEDWKPIFDRQIDDSSGSLAAINTRQIEQWIEMMPAAMTQAEKGM